MKKHHFMVEERPSNHVLHIAPELNFVRNFILPIIVQSESHRSCSDVLCGVSDYVSSDRENKLNAEMPPQSNLYTRDIKLRSNPYKFILTMIFMLRLIKKKQYNIIVCHTSIDSFAPILLIRFFTKSRIVYFNHGVPALGYTGLVRWVLQLIEKSNLTLSHTALSVGASMQAELNGFASFPKVALIAPGSACGIIQLATNLDALDSMRLKARARLRLKPDDRIALFVGRPVARKGFFDVLRAWQTLQRENFKLLLVGPSSDELAVAGLDMLNVEAVGYVEDTSIYYLAADVLCIPSYHEGFGYCYLEAAAAGCVPICSSIPGPTDFITDKQTGLCVPVGDVDAIAATLEQILENDIFRERLRVAAFDMSKTFERGQIVEKMIHFFETEILLSQHRGKS
jgi:glycosyltransferase involved in cell wall biosynthesis